jgi:hypothetical protein|tara:strand:- start:1117 stop:1227 length:111 start_codon:yes stop_codon:yes gene_type:complete
MNAMAHINPATVLAAIWLVGVLLMIDWNGFFGGGAA